MAAEKSFDPLIEHGAPQRTANDAQPLVEPLEIPIDGFHHSDGPGIIQDGALSAALDRAGIERNQ
jgi:hypothetical protein